METSEKGKSFDITMEKMEQIRKAVGDFKNSVASHAKDLHTDVKDWRFGVESHEEGVTVDISLKLLIKPKPEK